ncbi:MAG: RHS repeat domain-containing protein [Phycisphaerales bacterium]
MPEASILTNVYSSAGDLHDDEASRVTRVAEGSGGGATNRVRYWYLGAAQLVGTVYQQPSTAVRSNLFDSSDDYDGLDRFNRIEKSRWVQGTTDLYNVALTYDRNSNPTTLDDSVQTGFDWKYTYDALDRLAEAQAGTLSGGTIGTETRKQPFDLDQAGNWTHTDLVTGGSTTEYDWDFTHNKVNEITGWDNQSNNVTPTYDASGNMTDDKRDWKYEYDAWYRLVKVRDQSNNVKAEFKYNGLNYRIASRYDETAPWYYFAYDDRWRQVAMFEDSDTDPTEQYWYQNAGMSGYGGSSYIDDVILRDRDTDANGTLDERRYYLQNWHHDVVALIDTSGSISERVNYDAYGSPIGTLSSLNNRKAYAGYEYDVNLSSGGVAGSHTYHIRHRVYRSDLGVWTRRDPLGYGDGATQYPYFYPTRAVDAFGLSFAVIPCPPANTVTHDQFVCCENALGDRPNARGKFVCCNGVKTICVRDNAYQAQLGKWHLAERAFQKCLQHCEAKHCIHSVCEPIDRPGHSPMYTEPRDLPGWESFECTECHVFVCLACCFESKCRSDFSCPALCDGDASCEAAVARVRFGRWTTGLAEICNACTERQRVFDWQKRESPHCSILSL